MEEKRLNEMIVKLENELKNEKLDDGLVILSATLSHVLSLSINQGVFDVQKLPDFMQAIELNTLNSSKNKGIMRKEKF